MNIDATTIYLWQLADQVCLISQYAKNTAFLMSMLSTMALVVSTCAGEETAHVRPLFKRAAMLSYIGLIISSLLFTFVPTSKTVAMMVVVPEIVKSKVVQEDLPDIYNAAIGALKGALEP